MNTTGKAALVAIGLAATNLWAQTPASPASIEAGAARYGLDKGYADWTEAYVEGAYRFAPRQTAYATLRQIERFDLRDNELSGGYYHPLTPALTGVLEASYSDTHRVLANWSALGQLEYSIGDGFGLQLGYRRSEYTETATDLGIATVEKYFSDYRLAYTLFAGRPENASTGTSHRLALSRYYGNNNAISVAYTTGREIESVPAPIDVITTDIEAVVLYGRHWLTPAWGLTYSLERQRQGDLYTRSGFRIGLRYSF